MFITIFSTTYSYNIVEEEERRRKKMIFLLIKFSFFIK